MDIQSNNAWVNRSDTLIPVYETTVSSPIHTGGVTAGGSQIGQIYANEFYTLIGEDNYVTCRKICFRNSAGESASGFIETSPGTTLGNYDWVNYQEPFAYYCVSSSGTGLALAGNIGGYYAHGLRRNVTVIDANGHFATTLGGVIIGASDSRCGQNFTTYMRFEKVSYDGGSSWQDLLDDGYGYFFVSLQLEAGSMPNNRSVL